MEHRQRRILLDSIELDPSLTNGGQLSRGEVAARCPPNLHWNCHTLAVVCPPLSASSGPT